MFAINTDQLIAHVRTKSGIDSLIRDELLRLVLSATSLDVSVEDQLWHDFLKSNDLLNQDAYRDFLDANFLEENRLRENILLPYKLIKFREEKWGNYLNSLYLKKKDKFDSITFNMVRCRDFNVMQEIYFRLKDGEETWASIVSQLHPDEPNVSSLFGPAPRSTFSSVLIDHVLRYDVGIISPATAIGGWAVVTRLEDITTAQLNNEVKDQLLKEQFDVWFDEQVTISLSSVSFTESAITFELPPAILSLAR